MLKKLNARHKEIIRRLIVGETPEEISLELGMHKGSILRLVNDEPLFKTELGRLEYETERRLTDAQERIDVMGILREAENDAAQLCVDVIRDKALPGPAQIGMGTRLKSAWDVLDRRGHKAIEKKITLSLADLIVAAYEEAKKQRAIEDGVIDVEPEGS